MKLLQIRVRTLLLLMIPVALLTALVAAVAQVRVEARESCCHGNFSQMAIHLLNYRDAHGHYPPAIFTGQDGKPLHSWRALLYREMQSFSSGVGYDLAQPWNSPSNLAAAADVPSAFACPNNQGDLPRYTNYVAVIDRGISSLERADAIPRGSPDAARQILVIEYPNSDIPWTEPRDLDLDDLSRLSVGADPGGLGVVFADARFRRVSLEELRTLLGR